jgi:ubiquinone/menaquinone biosynthesis C-methylase UbiE
MANRFRPGRVDYEGSMARDFNAGRAVSPHAQDVWRSALEPYLGGATRVLDVGSGTGRFTVLLAQWFAVSVTGIEPASGMRKIAAVGGRHPNASYAGGRAEQLPFKAHAFDTVLLSNVYHHIPDRSSCAQELSRVLQTGGRVLIRGAFAGRLGEMTLFDYFPEAKLVCEEFPTLSETVENFIAWGFDFETVRPVVQQTCSSLKEFASRTRLRADTTLILLTDEEFLRRQAALEAAAARETQPSPVIDTLDLVVLRKPPLTKGAAQQPSDPTVSGPEVLAQEKRNKIYSQVKGET